MRVLVVDENILLAEIIKEIFEQRGISTNISTDGEDALKRIYEDKNYELILSEIKLAKIDGIQLAEDLRKKGNITPIVFFTVNTNMNIKEKAKNLGVKDYLIKPIDFNELLEIIEKYRN